MKALRLLSVLSHDPLEFAGRLATIGEGRLDKLRERPSYSVENWRTAIAQLGSALDCDFEVLMNESRVAEAKQDIAIRLKQLIPNPPFQLAHNADRLFAHICYALTRVLQPRAVVETGVCYGVTSRCVLEALASNGAGHLHSIDLPPLGPNADAYVGWFVPHSIRSRWTLYRGTSRRLLGPLISRLEQFDLYIHDSLHTYWNMKYEFRVALDGLRPGGVIVSDDIHSNSAFAELCLHPEVSWSAVLQEDDKNSLFGIAIKRS